MLKWLPMNKDSLPTPVRELPDPNPITRRKHLREVLWQITAPFGLGFVLLCVGATLVTINAIAPVGLWAEISTIFLIIPILLLSLIPLAIIIALAYGIMLLIPLLPPYTRLVQDAIRKVGAYARRWSDMAVEPILLSQSLSARVRSLLGKE